MPHYKFMFELLPENIRKIAQRKYISRLISLYSMGFLAVFAISISLLIPTYVYVDLKELVVINEQETLNQKSATSGVDTAQSYIASAKAKIGVVDRSKSIHPSLDVVDLVLSKVGSGIVVNSISYDRGSDTVKTKISLQGTAGTRDDLIRFSERLKSEPKFTKVDLPVSSFVKNKDVSFSVNIEGTF